MKRISYIVLIGILLFSCSKDDEIEPNITLDIRQGILGEWHVENECHRTHIWTFHEDGRFDLNFMDRTNTGSYTLDGRELTVRGYNDIGEGEMRNMIMVLTPNRMELDNQADFSIDYRFTRSCD